MRTMTVIMLVANVVMARNQGPDPLIHASAEAAYAQRLFHDECAYQEGLDSMDRAIRKVRAFRSPLSRDRDTAGALLARLEIEREQLWRRRRQLDAAARQLDTLVQAGQIETVRSRIEALAPPACDLRFTSLAETIERRSNEAANLVQAGDEQMRLGRPDRAIRLYLKARQANRDQTGLNERIAHAQALRPRGKTARWMGKAVLATVLVAGVGYAGYWAYKIQKERSSPSSAVRALPPPVYR